MADTRQTRREEARFRILRLLEENPQMSQRELAAAAGVGLGSVNYCLAALVERGLVKLSNFSQSSDKRRYSYNLTPKGIAEKTRLTNRFLRQKLAEFDALKTEIAELRREISQDTETEQERS